MRREDVQIIDTSKSNDKFVCFLCEKIIQNGFVISGLALDDEVDINDPLDKAFCNRCTQRVLEEAKKISKGE